MQMKKIKMRFFAFLFSLFSLLFSLSCENSYVQALLNREAQLASLDIGVYINNYRVFGGAAITPGFSYNNYDYTVHVPLETTRCAIDAAFRGSGKGTVTVVGEDGLVVDFSAESDLLKLILVVDQNFMKPSEYTVTLIRTDTPLAQLTALDISVLINGHEVEGAASMVPVLTPWVVDYTVYVPMETTRCVFGARLQGEGTVIFDDSDSANGYDFPENAEYINVTFTVHWERLIPMDYHLKIVRGNNPVFYIIAAEVQAFVYGIEADSGVSVEPSGNRQYRAFVPYETTSFAVGALLQGSGEVTPVGANDQGTFDFPASEDEKTVAFIINWEFMAPEEYRITIVRHEYVPLPRNVTVTVDPFIAAFFVGSGVDVTLEVTALYPAEGEISYQWYRNSINSNREGQGIPGATESRYTLSTTEKNSPSVWYYYVAVTNMIEGRVGTVKSIPRSITFIDKGTLSPKSLTMVNIPDGFVTMEHAACGWYAYSGSNINRGDDPKNYRNKTRYHPEHPNNNGQWNVSAYKIGAYPVTYELWKTVYDLADAAGYRFFRQGRQGAAYDASRGADNYYGLHDDSPVGNKLHPVTSVSWKDVIIWCNAYSEMDGKGPAYRDYDGNVIRSTLPLAFDDLIDEDSIPNYDGYRLPNYGEWMYAARGANPKKLYDPQWEQWSITYSADLADYAHTGTQTAEVGSKKPNPIGMYDAVGNVGEWVLDYESYYPLSAGRVALTSDFQHVNYDTGQTSDNQFSYNRLNIESLGNYNMDGGVSTAVSFRLACKP